MSGEDPAVRGLSELPALPEWLDGSAMFGQVAFVVRDLRAALATFTRVFGIGPWQVYRLGADLRTSLFMGKPSRWDLRLALSPWNQRPQIELLSPVAGESVQSHFLAEHGQGVQHVGMAPADFDASFRALTERGFHCVQEGVGYGRSRDGHLAYFDTRSILHGLMLEIIRVPTQRWDPVEIWPLDGPPQVTEEENRPWPR